MIAMNNEEDDEIFIGVCHSFSNVKVSDMASRAVFLYPDLDKSAVRALKAEERLLELNLQSIDMAKKTVVVDLKKSQNEMKKRLRKYRDRQRDITNSSKPVQENLDQSIEEFLENNIRNKTFTKNSLRPKTSPAVMRGRSVSRSSGITMSEPSEPIEIDPSFFTDQQRSKIDLRPSTGKLFRGNKEALRKFAKVRGLGEKNEQVRYFDKDELQDRETFYIQLLQWRQNKELGRYESLDLKVGKFCEEKGDDIKKRLMRNSCLRQSSMSIIGFHKFQLEQEIKRKYGSGKQQETSAVATENKNESSKALNE